MNPITRHEFVNLYRSRTVRSVASVMTVVVMIAALAGLVTQQHQVQERVAASEYARERWLGQGAKNPHGAAHFGTYVFAPVRALSGLAPGLDEAFGTVVRVEAHVRTPLSGRPMASRPSVGPFGWPSAVSLCELLLPLLAIALGHGTFASHDGAGLLDSVRTACVSRVRLAAGKLFGAQLAMLACVGPMLLGAAGLAVAVEPSTTNLVCILGIVLGITAYAWAWTAVSVAISAATERASTSLVLASGLWATTCLLAPQFAAAHAAAEHPMRDDMSFQRAVRDDLDAGMDGHDSQDARLAVLREHVLAEYGVARVEDLPINFDGLAMQAGEVHAAEVYAHHFDAQWDVLAAQERVMDRASVLAPGLALQRWAGALAQTDLAHHRRLAESVEAFRLEWVAALNDALVRGSRTGDWEYRADVELWATVPSFVAPKPAEIGSLMAQAGAGGVVLLGWSIVAGALALGLGVRRLSIRGGR